MSFCFGSFLVQYTTTWTSFASFIGLTSLGSSSGSVNMTFALV
jgi:hypothetical protein